jgi:hypothetical protein
MKRFASIIICVLSIFVLRAPALAANAQELSSVDYTIMVNDNILDTGSLPYSAYKEGTITMVPLRMIGEALGYTVEWLPETGDIIMEDSIQKLILRNNSATAQFQGKLKNIDLSREIELEASAVIHQGHTYVPLSLFEEFFNETSVDRQNIKISTSTSEI